MIQEGWGNLMNVKDKSARGLSWAVALTSIGVGVAVYVLAPGQARADASLAKLGDLEQAPAPASPANLLGLDQQGALDLLGPAKATESRGPATVWYYNTPRCELDLFFYMEMRTGHMRSLHYDFKNVSTPAERQGCLTAITLANSTNPSSGTPGENSVIAQSAAHASAESDAAPVPEVAPAAKPEPQAVRPEPRQIEPRQPRARRYSRRYASRPVWTSRGYTLALRYSRWPSGDASPTGWGGGLFGPAPYSANGSQ
jgi:hypothetical protein